MKRYLPRLVRGSPVDERSRCGFVRDRYVIVEQQSVVLGAHFIVMQRPLDAVEAAQQI